MKALDKKPDDRFILFGLERIPTEDSSTLTGSNTLIGGSNQSPRRSIGPILDPNLVKIWLESCEGHEHEYVQKEKARNPFEAEEGFRLIDVRTKRLVQLKIPRRYVALSYVWGDLDSLQTTLQTVTQLSRSRALDTTNFSHRGMKMIPLTILNSMELVRKIGLRYLWVDRLCIVQDDGGEKERLIHGMGRVYENAALTIIAASGSDSDAGLPGVSHRDHLPYERITKIVTGNLEMDIACEEPTVRWRTDLSMPSHLTVGWAWSLDQRISC